MKGTRNSHAEGRRDDGARASRPLGVAPPEVGAPDLGPPDLDRAMAVRDPRADVLFAERYQLVSRVGKGGMAEVWAALDTRTAREVALKIVSMDACEPGLSLARFRREAELAKQLRGVAFVEVFDHGVCSDGAFVAMDLLRGESLHERLERKVAFTLDEARALLVGVAAALRVAHALQVVHRDIKPGNVFFARIDTKRSGVQSLDARRETVKLLDFGIAKDAWDDMRLTQPGMVLGSAFYMSPEQIRSSRDVDTRADLWALAVILFTSLTCKRPFGSDPSAALARILFDPAPAPSSFRADLPASVDAFFAQAFDRDITRRFQTVDEMVEGFDAALAARDDVEVEVDVDDASPPRARKLTPLRDLPTRVYPKNDDETPLAEPVGAVVAPETPRRPDPDDLRATVVPATEPIADAASVAPLAPALAPAFAPKKRAHVAPLSMPPYLSRRSAWSVVSNILAVLVVAALAIAAWWFKADLLQLVR